MGAVANMAPECYAGVEADVPFVDALTSILDRSLPLTVTEWDEWGDPLDVGGYLAYMKSYTPYENAPDSENDERTAVFSKIFITTSMNDTRVLYVEPMKWLARLQHAMWTPWRRLRLRLVMGVRLEGTSSGRRSPMRMLGVFR